MVQDTRLMGMKNRPEGDIHLTGNMDNRTEVQVFPLTEFSFSSPFIKDKQLVFK